MMRLGRTISQAVSGGTSHVTRKRLDMPGVLSRTSLMAWVLGFSMLGAAGFGVGPNGAAAEPSSSPAAVPLIYYKGRNFRIPITLPAATRNRIKEVILLVSENSGYKWRAVSKTFPDHPTFSFRSSHDGEYWFAVQTLTVDGQVSPRMRTTTVEPNLKVVVDTMAPSLVLEPERPARESGQRAMGSARTSTWISNRWSWSTRSRAWACGDACRSLGRSGSARRDGTPARPRP